MEVLRTRCWKDDMLQWRRGMEREGEREREREREREEDTIIKRILIVWLYI